MHFQRYFSLFQMRDFKAKERLKTNKMIRKTKERINSALTRLVSKLLSSLKSTTTKLFSSEQRVT